jgi:hypothetical protein
MTTKEKSAEVCKICVKQMEVDNLPPRIMVTVGLTEKKNVEVFACPVCDGGVVSLAQRG